MKKIATIMLAVICLVLSACGNKNTFVPDYDSAIGVIIISDTQELPSQEKIYAAFENNEYTYDFDSANVFFFQANEEESYAGDQNLYKLQFSADIDSQKVVGTVGAIGYKAGTEATVSAYYLYHDENGVYFSIDHKFEQLTLQNESVINGTDYTCELTFTAEVPVSTVAITYYDKDNGFISSDNYTADEISKLQIYKMESTVASVSVITYSEDGSELETKQITPVDHELTILSDNGGVILAAKTLIFSWS